MDELSKRYYGIREVAEMFHVNISILRYYEKEFPTLKPRKNRAGDRIYTKEDIAELQKIFDLVKEKGLTLAGAREHLKNQASRQAKIKQMVSKLIEVRGFLVTMQETLTK